jgi:hypothetical protein
MKFGRLPEARGGIGTPFGCGSDRAAKRMCTMCKRDYCFNKVPVEVAAHQHV